MKIHRYCDADNIFQNESKSPQGSSGMKQNRHQPTQQTQLDCVESRDSFIRTEALSNLFIFNSKCLADGKAPYSFTLPPKYRNYDIQDEALEMQEFDFNSNTINRGKKSSAEKLFEPLTATVVRLQKACQ